MKNKKSKKGFTLVELIVAIAIMGVILIIALPQVRKIQSSNKDRKYEAYRDSIIAGSKLYIDSYSKDLFGDNKSGCVRIKYSELKHKNLVKDFSSKDISCSNDAETFVEVRKVIDEYKYKINMTCKNKSSNKEVYKITQVTGGEESCSEEPDMTTPLVEISPKNSNNKWYNSKNLAVKIKVSDVSGLNSNISLKYNWYNKTTGKTTVNANHNFKNKKGVETLSYTIPTSKRPQDAGGKYKLTVSPDDSTGNGIQDALGNKSLTSISTEEYWIDNETPKFNGTSLSSSSSTFASKNVILHMAATDNFTAANELKVYISNSGYQTGGSWQNYSTSMNWTLSGSYDGKARTVYVSIKDLAGNIEQKTFSYTIYKECSATVDNGTWYDTGTCSKKCGTGTKPQEKKQNDKYLNTVCPNVKQTVNCNTMECCSSIRYEDGNSCTVSCGGGTKNRLAYSVYDNSRCPAKDTSSGGSSCNPQDCCSKVTYKDGSNCTAVCNGGTRNREAYSAYNGTRCSSKDLSSGGSACNTRGCCSSTYAGTWSSWGGCSVSCGGGTRSRYRYLYSNYTGQYCSTQYDSGSCNTHSCLGTNNCRIRGSSIKSQSYSWVCDSGHTHRTGYTHYCTDGNGTVHTKDSNPGLVTYRWICPTSPYGPADGWSIYND